MENTVSTLPYFFLQSVQFSHSVMSNSAAPWTASMPGFPVHHKLLKTAQTHVN